MRNFITILSDSVGSCLSPNFKWVVREPYIELFEGDNGVLLIYNKDPIIICSGECRNQVAIDEHGSVDIIEFTNMALGVVFGNQSSKTIDTDLSHNINQWYQIKDEICHAYARMLSSIHGRPLTHKDIDLDDSEAPCWSLIAPRKPSRLRMLSAKMEQQMLDSFHKGGVTQLLQDESKRR